MNKQMTLPAPSSQTGAVLTLEAMLLVLVGLVMAISYAIIVYDAISAYFIVWLSLAKSIFDTLAAAFLTNVCTGVQVVEPIIIGPDDCNTAVAGVTAQQLINLIPSIELP